MIETSTEIEFVICDATGPVTAVDTAERAAKLYKWYQAKYPDEKYILERVTTIKVHETIPVE